MADCQSNEQIQDPLGADRVARTPARGLLSITPFVSMPSTKAVGANASFRRRLSPSCRYRGTFGPMADPHLTLPERSALLALMTLVRKASNADLNDELGFKIDKKVRERLVELGYIVAQQTGRYRAWMYELKEEGWRRGEEELGSPTPKGAPKATRLQYALTRRFAAYMTRSEKRVADIFVLDGAPTAPVVDITDRIRVAYTELATAPGSWVSLTRLRGALGDLPRADLDAALLQLVLEPKTRLNPEFNQKTLTPADRAAALHTGGEDVHLLSIEQP
ncbi:hypothetical protein QDK53_00400 [Amycolatopsis magusensis]|nr:hypothetical protein [Amycolatopsis magusensis]